MGDDLQISIRRSPLRRLTGVQIVGTGSFLPDNVVTNEALASLGCDAEWIIQRTGIRERRHAPPEMSTSDMAVAAAERCLAAADVDRATRSTCWCWPRSRPTICCPPRRRPCRIGSGLNCAAMDVSAACAGFMYALVTGMQFVATGCSKYALVIGADTNSRVMNPGRQENISALRRRRRRGADHQGQRRARAAVVHARRRRLRRTAADAAGRRLARAARSLDSESSADWFVKMDGRPVFKWAVRLLEDSSRQVLDAAGFKTTTSKLWLFHQANIRILDAATDALAIDRNKVETHLDRYGNTSAGSVPIALDEALRAGRFGRGDLLLMCGFGGGLSWGTALMRW